MVTHTSEIAMTRVPRARTMREMNFVLSLRPCPACGRRDDTDPTDVVGSDDRWALSKICPGCGQRRTFTWSTHGDPFAAPHPRLELGGPAPSEIIEPAELSAEHARLRPLTLQDPRALAPGEWRSGRDAVSRTLTCVLELLKFPDDALGTTRTSLLAERDRLLATIERYTEDAPRIWALDPAR